MIFKPNGDLIVKPADKIAIWTLDTAFDHDWIKMIAWQLKEKCPEDESKVAEWSELLHCTVLKCSIKRYLMKISRYKTYWMRS